MKFGVGQSPRRMEDERLLTGRGRYTDDFQPEGTVYGVTVRSPYGHARIAGIDTAEARAMPGVLAIYTAEDIAHYGPIPCLVTLPGRIDTPRPVLAKDTVRFVGDAVAFVVAETRAEARAAAEAVAVDYEDLPAVGSLDAALAPGAPAIWPDAPGNTVFDWHAGDADAVQAALASAAHVTRLRLVQNRIAPTSMEVRAALGEWSDENGLTLTVGSQGVASMHGDLSRRILKCPPDRLRVITGDVGGGFGMKVFLYPEYALVLHAAERLQRPVKWTGDRSDAFQTDSHGRAVVSEAALALDGDGNILALAVESWSDLGAYQAQFGPAIQTMAGGRIIGGVYRIPAMHNHVHGVITNTAPVDAYRGAGRPEATYLVERLIETAARETGRDAGDLRRRNLLRPDELPHANGLGLDFDVGDFPALLDAALENADWNGFPARRAAAEARGRRYGRGIGYYVEIAGGGATEEFADVRFLADGTIEAAVGTQSNGQGHETSYAQVLAERLGVPMEQVKIVQGDTARLEVGYGTGGSRSMVWGGGAIIEAAASIIEKGRHLARADLGEDVDFDDGLFRARGSNRTLSWPELSMSHPQALDTRARYAPEAPRPTFPNGCHIAEVEIDPETGRVQVARYSIVDDFGTLVNPRLVEGQVHGGIAQGLGQALLENVVYDDSAQLLTGSFMDYGIPRADDMPRDIIFHSRPVPNPNNPLGAKGCGEAGTIGAMPSIMNAIVDALGGTHVDMPATPETLWRVCRALGEKAAA
ncbi:xanthine dehydrogenase family protein molybdopterin-binding subunit [Sphingosinicella soli]|uniref:Carbon-monoxide dehydrogenase large subunit n=1 Tax=Sphingosinicella soli TaxID=333708 RepID=A0A7W7B4G6_9SPHN|nr:xanthine dehydrogenase family protein molybdopterin-binding subunit [Sphingosinicella soli]MBB4633822.1 carbon-monoxide dehydrogenase large subunit [Sphingosinicella soli]